MFSNGTAKCSELSSAKAKKQKQKSVFLKKPKPLAASSFSLASSQEVKLFVLLKPGTYFYIDRPLTHVIQGSNRGAKLLEEEGVVGLSTAKVDDLDDVHVGHDDVLCLNVQMEDASGVEVIKTLKDLHNIGHHVVLGVSESETHHMYTNLIKDSSKTLSKKSSRIRNLRFHKCNFMASPVDEAEEQLLSAAVLGDEHQVARRDVSFVQSHDPLVVKGLEDVVFLQHFLFAVCLVRDDLSHEEVARGVFPAFTNHTETTPVSDK